MKHFGFPSIEQYRNAVKIIRGNCDYHQVPYPILKFRGTVKLHGTNAGVVMDLATNEIWAQSREHVITPTKDNEGFAMFVLTKNPVFIKMFDEAKKLATEGATHIAIFGEWCGKGIMKGVAINQLDKMFVVFGVRVITDDGGEVPKLSWFTPAQIKEVFDWTNPQTSRIFNIGDFKTFEVMIDFSKPEEAQNILADITKGVEDECPVGAAFEVSGVGEGVVWKPVEQSIFGINLTEIIFKVKGAKHSDTKTKQLVEVDLEKVSDTRAFAEATVTDHRLDKMLAKLQENGIEVDVKNTGEFLKLVAADIVKEETDRLTESGFSWKDVAGPVNAIAKQWWMTKARNF